MIHYRVYFLTKNLGVLVLITQLIHQPNCIFLIHEQDRGPLERPQPGLKTSLKDTTPRICTEIAIARRESKFSSNRENLRHLIGQIPQYPRYPFVSCNGHFSAEINATTPQPSVSLFLPINCLLSISTSLLINTAYILIQLTRIRARPEHFISTISTSILQN